MPKSPHSMEEILMAGVRKLPSGTWQGWCKHYEGNREFFTISHTATKRDVLAAAQHLEVQHAQIRQGVRPRPGHQAAMLGSPIGDVIQAYLDWGQLQWTAKHYKTRRQQLAWWQA